MSTEMPGVHLDRYYAAPRLPLWVRVWLFAVDHDGQRLARTQIHKAVDPLRRARSSEIARAIRQGVANGMLAPGSCAAVLHLTDERKEQRTGAPGSRAVDDPASLQRAARIVKAAIHREQAQKESSTSWESRRG